MNSTISLSMMGALALLALGTGQTAFAGQAAEPAPTRVVDYADLNLDSPAGISALYRRIRNAAHVVCDFSGDTRRLVDHGDQVECRSRATERAVAQVGLPALKALHLASTLRNAKPARVVSIR